MKFNKLDLILFINNKNISGILYLLALLLILVPASITIITDVPFSSAFSKVFIGIATALVIIGRIITLCKKEKGDKSIPIDIGIILGILIAFISNVLK